MMKMMMRYLFHQLLYRGAQFGNQRPVLVLESQARGLEDGSDLRLQPLLQLGGPGARQEADGDGAQGQQQAQSRDEGARQTPLDRRGPGALTRRFGAATCLHAAAAAMKKREQANFLLGNQFRHRSADENERIRIRSGARARRAQDVHSKRLKVNPRTRSFLSGCRLKGVDF